jgi:HD superfamily phosphohydrolase
LAAADYFEYKTINDPVHGSIKVSRVELAVINTVSFQRLRGLKQLGLADLVFPGATHTRFAHSLGVLHIVSQMLLAIENNHRRKHNSREAIFGHKETQKIRLAALLHDIGHLPLSHAMEQPLQRQLWESSQEFVQPKKQGKAGQPKRVFGELDKTASADLNEGFSHEKFGMELLENRSDLRQALGAYNKDNEIGKIFTKFHPSNYRYSQFISGTFDADRIDFLLRDSLAAGVSYGNIDLQYLLDNMNYDTASDHFYVDFSGIHALEHFITARFFLYNITYHKTVMGFELLAKHAYFRMMSDQNLKVPFSKEDLHTISSNDSRFLQFTDSFFWQKLHQWKPRVALDRAVKHALLFRCPPVELYTERVLPDSNSRNDGDSSYNILNSKIYDSRDFLKLADRHHLDTRNMACLENKIKFSEIAPLAPHEDEIDVEKEWELCRVFFDGEVRKLIDVKQSVISVLSSYKLQFKRLLYLPVDGRRPNRTKIRAAISKIPR